jgi:hypothetical protein
MWRGLKILMLPLAVLGLAGCSFLYDYSGNWQVYDGAGDEFLGSFWLRGEPEIPALVLDGGDLPGATLQAASVPWTIKGAIRHGKMALAFMDPLELSDEYASEYTGGVKIAQVHVMDRSSRNVHVALHRDPRSPDAGVIIYYASGDFDHGQAALKAGWNFWDAGRDIITQDIIELFDLGYRWQIESWM